jgi:hypothetical protein
MAWNNLAIVGNALSRDYIWDFGSGSLTLGPLALDLSGADDSFTVFTHTPNSTLDTSVTYAISDTGLTNANHWSIEYSPSFGIAPVVTRTNIGAGYLAGPQYFLTYVTSGIYTPTFIPYATKAGSPFGTINPGAPYSLHAFESPKEFTIQLFQQAVSITLKSSSTGPSLVDGTTITDMDNTSNKTIIVDKSNNRGDTISSVWSIQKQNPVTGIYSVATVGVDYTLGVGQTLTTDQIAITWQSIGNFKLFNNTTGASSGTSGPNLGSSVVNFTVGQGVTDTIILPNVVSTITPVVAYNNTIISTNPLVGITPFQVTVSATIDVTSASWTQAIGVSAPVVLPMSIAAWQTEILSRCNITCQVKQGTAVLQQGIGFGPFTFTIPTGSFQVGYVVTPKTGNALINESSR